jgi:hypothetical protein
MESPSRLFLARLANDESAPATLRLDAARLLPGAEHRMAGQRAVRARQRSDPNEEERREIDRILAEAAKELGIDLGLDDAEGPETLAECSAPIAVGTPAALPNVPPDEVSSDAGSRSRDMRVQFQSEPPAVRLPDSDVKREELLAQGRVLAASVLIQYERFTRCPHNLQESKRLEYLQGQFLKWEREAQLRFPGIDLSEFANPRLRPAPPKVDFSDRQLMVPEMCLLSRVQPQPQVKGPRDDGSLWAAAGPGI